MRVRFQAAGNLIRLLSCITLFSGHAGIRAESVSDEAVQLSAHAQPDPPLIAISWPVSTSAVRYEVYRKTKDATAWGPAVVSLDASATHYTDTNVLKGVNYAYRVTKADDGHGGEGLIYCGIPVTPAGSRGIGLFIGDNSNPPNQFSSGGGSGGGGGGSGGGAEAQGRLFQGGTNSDDPGQIVIFPGLDNQGGAGPQIESGFAPESSAYAAAASVCALFSLLAVRRAKIRLTQPARSGHK